MRELGKANRIPVESQMDLESLRKFIREKVIPDSFEREKNGTFPLDLYRALYEMGYVQAYVPAELGGLGASSTDLAWIMREIAYGSAGIASSLTASMMGILPVLLYGSEKLKKSLAEEFLNSFMLSSFCWTEPDTGSDVFRIKTKAVKLSGGYILSGQKCFISNANYAHHYTVMAQVHGETASPKLTLFYVPARTQGISVGKPLEKLGQWSSNTSSVYFDQVFVPEEHRIQNEGDGARIAIHCLQRNRTMFAAGAVGVCHRASDLVVGHLGGRVLYGKPLLAQPAIRSLLAQLQTEVRAAWLLVCSAAAFWDAGINECQHSSMAKLFAGHTAVKFTSEVLELFGGYGYMKECEIERLFRDAKLYEIIEGPSFVQQALIAKELFPSLSPVSEQPAGEIIKLRKAA